MVKTSEIQMTAKILEEVRDLGFEAIREPTVSPDRSLMQRLLRWRENPVTLRPDLIVKHKGKSVVVEVKRQQVMPMSVELMLDYLDHIDALDAKGVICVPDAVFPEIAGSVSKYANRTGIRICSISEIRDVLSGLLSSPDIDHQMQ